MALRYLQHRCTMARLGQFALPPLAVSFSSAELAAANAPGAFLHTPAPGLDIASGPSRAGILSSAWLGFGNLRGRAQFLSVPALAKYRSPTHCSWVMSVLPTCPWLSPLMLSVRTWPLGTSVAVGFSGGPKQDLTTDPRSSVIGNFLVALNRRFCIENRSQGGNSESSDSNCAMSRLGPPPVGSSATPLEWSPHACLLQCFYLRC